MRPVFEVFPTSAMREKYRALLRGEWTDPSLQAVLALVREAIERKNRTLVFSWEQSRRQRTYPIPPAAEDYLVDFLERANTGLAVEMPERVAERTELERLAYQVAVFATFQSRLGVRGDVAFLRDLQSLLLLVSVHVLLPKLVKNVRHAHDLLWNALAAHVQLGGHVPAHSLYLWSVLLDAVGDRGRARDMLLASIHDTNPREHDFLTKAQAYWSALIEEGRLPEAKGFVLDLYRHAPEADLAEIQQLIDLTFAPRRARQAG